MPVSDIISQHKTINKCKHCRVAHRCLPGNLDKKLVKQLSSLSFKATLLEPGEHLFRQGTLQDKLYILRSGILKSYTIQENGKEFIMGFHLPPDLLGWEGIDEGQLDVSVIALDHASVCEIPVEDVGQLIREIPGLHMQFLHLVGQRIKSNNVALLRSSAEQRVATFILELAKHYTTLGYPYYLCKLMMTHQDIANFLRIAPETLSRTFHNLQNKKIISITKHNVYLNQVDKLNEIALPAT